VEAVVVLEERGPLLHKEIMEETGFNYQQHSGIQRWVLVLLIHHIITLVEVDWGPLDQLLLHLLVPTLLENSGLPVEVVDHESIQEHLLEKVEVVRVAVDGVEAPLFTQAVVEVQLIEEHQEQLIPVVVVEEVMILKE